MTRLPWQKKKSFQIEYTEQDLDQLQDSPYSGIQSMAKYYWTLRTDEREVFFKEISHLIQEMMDLINVDRYAEYETITPQTNQVEVELPKPKLLDPKESTLKKIHNIAYNFIQILESRRDTRARGIQIPIQQIDLAPHNPVIDPMNRIKDTNQLKRIERLKAQLKRKPRWEIGD